MTTSDLPVVPVEPELPRLLAVVGERQRQWTGDEAGALRTTGDLVARWQREATLRRAGDGLVWTLPQGDDLAIVVLDLPDPAVAGQVREALVDLAREAGLSGLTLGVRPGDAAAAAFVSPGGVARRIASQLRLVLTPADADTGDMAGEVRLLAMGEDAYRPFFTALEEEYAAELADAGGASAARAQQVAAEQLAELLPDGLATPDEHLLVAEWEGERIGRLWLSSRRPVHFVYDVHLDPAYRGRGLGTAVMRAASAWAAARGARGLQLNVFAHNEAARRVYDRLGYLVVEDAWRVDVEP